MRAERFEVELDRLLDHRQGLLLAIALADAAGQVRHVGGAAALGLGL